MKQPIARALGSVLAALALLLGPGMAQAEIARAPSPRSLEYRLSWGAGAVRALKAYRAGASGAGVTVAMIDTGLAGASGLFRHVSPASVDLVPQRGPEQGADRHGVQTASLLAGALDRVGTFGVAYDATLLSIRADRDGSCRRVCSFDPQVLAAGIDYAVAEGAQVIGLPLASARPIPAVEAALLRAVDAGALIVASAGNQGGAAPLWPARYAEDARFAGSMIVAGATTPTGKMANWSNKAGAASARYLAAPGDRVVVDCGARTCSLVSGTSYSVAYVAGAAALLLSSHPDLSAPDLAQSLLDGARDLGRRGADAESGRGRLDVARSLRWAEAREEARGS